MREAMGMTGHRSLVTFLKYFQPGLTQHSRAAHLLEDTPENLDPASSTADS
jgi:hypothetical protein